MRYRAKIALSNEDIISHSAEETEEFAVQLASSLKLGENLALCGELGSGKTTFVRGLYRGLGGDPDILVTSPTFTLLHEYPTKNNPLYHFDLYRIKTIYEFENLSFDDYFTGPGICVVEWADKIEDLKNYFKYTILFENRGGDIRQIIVNMSQR